ncbi:LysR family transcriptional regulator [Nocardia sp. JMUB6875]|uniref:LysR family transcriptional regulator n=1 Tax=Nocardia sp. JMUB6875 TaxID=3158170 RepID=UPI0032E6ABC9
MPHLDTQHVRSFVAVAKESNITRAAAQLHLTQQAVSLHIQQLERNLGVSLLIRTPRGVVLTPAGAELAAGGGEILADLDALGQRVQAVARRQEGRLRIACCPYAATDFATTIADALEISFPGLQVDLLTIPATEDGWQLLLSEAADVAFMWPPIDQDPFMRADVRADTRMVALPEDHPLIGRESVTLSDLADDPIVKPEMFLPEDAARLRATPGSIRVPMLNDLLDAILLVARGRGILMAPEPFARAAAAPGVRWLPVSDAQPAHMAALWLPRAPIGLISRLVAEVRAVTGWTDEPADGGVGTMTR